MRDRALILLGFAGALRRSELVALTVAYVERHPEGDCESRTSHCRRHLRPSPLSGARRPRGSGGRTRWTCTDSPGRNGGSRPWVPISKRSPCLSIWPIRCGKRARPPLSVGAMPMRKSARGSCSFPRRIRRRGQREQPIRLILGGGKCRHRSGGCARRMSNENSHYR
jgi:hypothetical protein